MILSMLDYAIGFGLPGMLVGFLIFWLLVKKVKEENRVKYLKIGSYLFVTPYIIDMIIFGPTSYLSLVFYAAFGITGIILAILSAREKRWLQVILYLLPMVLVIATVSILGP